MKKFTKLCLKLLSVSCIKSYANLCEATICNLRQYTEVMQNVGFLAMIYTVKSRKFKVLGTEDFNSKYGKFKL